MKKVILILKFLLIIVAIGISLYGGFIIAVCCSCNSCGGAPFAIDLSFLYSFFGLCFLIIGILILIKMLKKYEKYLHLGIFIYGILMAAACIFVNKYSEYKLNHNNYFEIGILQPNGISTFIAFITVIGLIFYPFIKEN